jgi:hypothetical protein
MSKGFSPKTPAGEEFFTLNFVRELAPNETILSAEWTVAVMQGVDANPSAMLSGSPVIVGTKVSQKLIGGVDGVQYCLTCVATTTGPQKIPLFDTLWVRASCAQSA